MSTPMRNLIRAALALAAALTLAAPALAGVGTPVGAGVTLGVPTPYTGLVATRTAVPVSFTAGNTWEMSRSLVFARENLSVFRVFVANFYVNGINQEVGPGSPSTFKISSEYPLGATAILCADANGNTTITVPSGGIGVVTCRNNVPSGQPLRINDLYQNATGIIYSGIGPAYYDLNRESFTYGTGTPTDLTAGGVLTSDGFGGNGNPPLAIVATTTKPSVCLVGDSRLRGILDTASDYWADAGEVAKSIGPYLAYTHLDRAGTTAEQALTNFTARLQMIQYCSHVVDEYGINSLNGLTAAQEAASHTSMAAMLGKPTFSTTLAPNTASTDNWLTTGNQTVNVAAVPAYNTLVRAGILGEVGYFDVADGLDPYRSGVWPVSLNPATTTGTAKLLTGDGNHETATGNTLIRERRVIDTAAFK